MSENMQDVSTAYAPVHKSSILVSFNMESEQIRQAVNHH